MISTTDERTTALSTPTNVIWRCEPPFATMLRVQSLSSRDVQTTKAGICALPESPPTVAFECPERADGREEGGMGSREHRRRGSTCRRSGHPRCPWARRGCGWRCPRRTVRRMWPTSSPPCISPARSPPPAATPTPPPPPCPPNYDQTKPWIGHARADYVIECRQCTPRAAPPVSLCMASPSQLLPSAFAPYWSVCTWGRRCAPHLSALDLCSYSVTG